MSDPIPDDEWLEAATNGSLTALEGWKKSGLLEAIAFERLTAICDGEKNNALQIAIQNQHEDYAMALIELGRWPDSLNDEHDSTLRLAVYYDMAKIVQLLIDMGHDTRKRPEQKSHLMDVACWGFYARLGQVLLDNGVKEVLYCNLSDLVYETSRRLRQVTDTINHGMEVEFNLIDKLLAEGVSPEWRGDRVVDRSCLQQWSIPVQVEGSANPAQIELLRILLKHGEEPGQRIRTPNHEGVSSVLGMSDDHPLHKLIREHHAQVCREVMDEVVDIPNPLESRAMRRM